MLSYSIASAKLKEATRLRAATSSLTPRSSTASMLQKYLRIEPDLSKVDNADLLVLIPLSQEHNKIEELGQRLQRLDDVTKTLQSESCTISDAGLLFDCVLEEYPNVSDRLSAAATIISSQIFSLVPI